MILEQIISKKRHTNTWNKALSESHNYSMPVHGRLAKWRKWRACDVGKVNEGLENELWRMWSNGRDGERAVTYVKLRKGLRMSSEIGEVIEMLENELCLQFFSYFNI